MSSSLWSGILTKVIRVGIFLLLLTPFIVTHSLYFPFITGKAFFFRIVVEIIFSSWVILAILDSRYRPRMSWIINSFALFLVTIFFSNIFGVNISASFLSNLERMEGYITLVHVFALALVVSSVFKERKDWIVFFHASVIASVVMIFSAWSQISKNGFAFRVDTSLGNPIYLAAYMLFNSFISLWLIAQIKKDTFKGYARSIRFWSYAIVWFAQVIIIIQTQTRGAMIGLFVGLSLIFALVALFVKGERVARIFSIVSLVVIISCAAGIYLGRDSDFVKSIPGLNRLTTISATEGTGQARLWNWSIAWQGVKERPLLGWGQSNYNIVFDKYYDPKMFEQEAWFDRSHSIIFDWLIAGGFVGLILYLTIFIAALSVLYKNTNSTPLERIVIVGLLSAYFIHNVFVFDTTTSYLLFGVIIAYIISLGDSSDIKTKDSEFTLIKKYVCILIIILTPFTIYFLNYKHIVSGHKLLSAISLFKKNGDQIFYAQPNGFLGNMDIFKEIIALDTLGNAEIRYRLLLAASEISTISNAPGTTKQDFISYAESEMIQQMQEAPGDTRYPYFLASLFSQIGQYEIANQYLQKAVDISPRRQIFWFYLADNYVAMNNKEGAVEAAEFGYKLAPQFDAAWIHYASVLAVVDKKKFDQEVADQMAAKNYTRVEKLILNNLNRNPNTISNYTSLSVIYFEMGDLPKAVEWLDKAIEKFPEAKVQLGKLRQQVLEGGDPVGKTF